MQRTRPRVFGVIAGLIAGMAAVCLPFAPVTSMASEADPLIATRVMTTAVQSGETPVEIVLSDDGAELYVAAGNYLGDGQKAVYRIDALSGRVLARNTITTDPANLSITALAVDPGASRVWLIISGQRFGFDRSSLSLVATAHDPHLPLIDLVPGVSGAPMLGLTNGFSSLPSALVAIDPSSGRTLRTVDLLEADDQRQPANWYLSARRLAIDPAGERIYALPEDSTDLVIVDAASLTVVARVPAGPNPAALVLSPTANEVFVADIDDRVLRRFDATTLDLLGASDLPGRCPGPLVIDTLGERAVVGNPCGGNPLQAFSPTDGRDLSRAFATSNGMGLAMRPDGSIVYDIESGGGAISGYRLVAQSQIAAERKAATPLPLQPRSVSVALSGTTVRVSWVPPANSRRSKVTQYRVTAKPGGTTCATKASTGCLIRGLDEGRTYAFTVEARGLSGTGPKAVSRFVSVPRPVTPPAPTPEPKPSQQLS